MTPEPMQSQIKPPETYTGYFGPDGIGCASGTVGGPLRDGSQAVAAAMAQLEVLIAEIRGPGIAISFGPGTMLEKLVGVVTIRIPRLKG